MKTFKKINKNNLTEYQFFPCENINDIPGKINAALSFLQICNEYVFIKKPNNEYDLVGGKIKEDETISECLIRETYEEAGVIIDFSKSILIGYIKAENRTDDRNFEKINYMPVYTSFITNIIRNWAPHKDEVQSRHVLSIKESINELKKRNDNEQLLDIFNYLVEKIISMGREIKFKLIEKEFLIYENSAPVTQVMTFCKKTDGTFCVVRDHDEDFLSLPGGMCELDEEPIDCAKRELLEEAQITAKKINLIGAIFVEMYINGQIISQAKQIRYESETDSIDDFIPRKNNFETEERLFIPKEDLIKKVKQLDNKTGQQLISILSKK